MPETTIAISEAALARLKELAGWANVSLPEALEQAIKDQHDWKFWDAVNAGYAALRCDPAASAEFEAERKLWDSTLLDGLDQSERWGEHGDTLPGGQEHAS